MIRGLLLTTLLLVLIWSCSATEQRGIDERTTVLPVKRTGPTEGESAADAPSPSPTLNAVTINLAHGRKDSMNQLLVSEEQSRKNLDDIAHYLKASNADVDRKLRHRYALPMAH